ncbi:MAG: tetratricopeptide repeat protein, partial [Deltaproteobacteria bacterium]|nr:tetratricopeptide repeat protein [Deltaproteobacteria bacterium]
ALHSEAARWPETLDALGRQRDLAAGAGAMAEARAIEFRMSLVELDELGDPDASLATLARILTGDAAHEGAIETLGRIERRFPAHGRAARTLLADAHRRRGDDRQLAVVLEKAVTLDAPGAGLHAELARLFAGPLADPGRAWGQAARGYALEPSGEEGLACRGLLFAMFEAIAAAEGSEPAGRRLVSTLTETALGLSSASAREARLAADLAEIEGMDGAVSAAAQVPLWRAILRTRPALGPVLDAFEHWSRREADQSWLAEALELRIGVTPVEARTDLELELAFVLASLASRQDQAIATFEQVLHGVNADESQRELAFDGLDELLDKNNRHEARARLLESRLGVAGSPERLARIRLALASTRWRRLGDASGAVDLLVELVGASEVPASVATGTVDLLETIWGEGTERSRIYRALEPVYVAARDWDKLVALYTSTLEQDDPALQIECLTKLAELERSELDRPEAAFSTLLALIERESDPIAHLGELEVLAGSLGRWEELASRLEALVGLGHGGAPLMARLARIHEVERHDPERAAHFYRFAFEDDANDTASRDALSAILERFERWDELVRHLLAAADRESADAAAGQATTQDRHVLRRRAAEILDKQLAQPSEAVAVLELIGAEAAPESHAHGEAQEAAAQILERTQDYAALHKHYRRWVEVAPTDQLAVDLQVRLGRSLIRFPTTAREGLTELEEVWRTAPSRRDVIPALWSMIVACERAEAAAGGIVGGAASARAGTSAIDPLYAEATADAARLLEEIIGDNAPATTLAGIVQAQLRVLPAGEERQATLIRLARLMTDLEAPERAFGYLAEALRGDLESASIEGELEAIAETHGYWDALAALYEECSGDGDEHASERYVLKVGNILSERLGRAEEAASWYERYLLAQPGSRDAVEPLVAYYREVADAASEARVLEAWIEYSASADELPALRMRLGVLRMDQLGDAQGAIDALEGCLPEGAADAELVRRLERLYVRGEHFPALVELYRAALQHLVGDEARGEALQVLAKMTQVYETRLSDLPSARETARRMLELEALNRFALTSLERIERALGEWDAVDEILGKKLEATPVEAARVKVLIDRAEVAAQHRQRPDEAIEFLLAADRIVGPGPGQDELVKGLESLLRSEPVVRLKAAKALAKRYRPREAWQSLINVLMIELVASSDSGERFALATQAAEIASERLRDKAVALRVLVTALRQSPEAADLRTLVERTAREVGDFAMVLKTGDDMLRRGVPETAVVGFALWLGALERNFGDRARAIAAYERVLEFEPGNGEAGDALAGLYRDGGDWTALKGLHTQRLAVAAPGERPMLELDHALNLAGHLGLQPTVQAVQGLLQTHVGEPRLRATLLSRVSEPLAGPAATAVLAHELKAGGRWAELIKLYEIRAEKTPSVEERVTLWREAAAVSETHIGDRVVAVRLLGRAAEASPNDLGPWRELRSLAMQIGAHDELARALARGVETADPAIVPELAIGLAELEAAHLGLEDGIERARSTLRMGLDQSPGNLALHEALVRLELGVGEVGAAEAEVSALTDLIEDDAVACGWWRELRTLAEQKGDEARVVIANEALLARDHRDADAAEHLASFYRKGARWDDLVELLFLRIEAAEVPEEAAAHWREVAQLRAGPLGDGDGALEAWQEAWALWSGSAEATRKLVAHAAERGEWSEVASLWERHAEAAPSVADQAAAWLELGRVRDEKLKLSDEAVEAFEAAATLASGAPELTATALAALNALVAIHGRTRRFAELAATLERKAEVAVTRPEKALAWVQAAAVRLDQLREPAAARPILEQVLALDPDHLEGRLLLARLLVREGRAAEAVTTLKDLVVRTEGKRRVRLLMDLARLQANEVGDPVGAAASVDEALALEPQTPGLEALALDVMARAESWPRLRELLERSFEAARSDADRADRALRLARLFAGPLADEEALGRWLAEAQAAEPGSVEVRALEAERLEQRGDLVMAEVAWTEVVELLAGRRAAEELMRASHRLGLLREQLGRTEAALAAFKRAHDIDGKYVPNLIDYGRALVTGGHWTEALAIHQSLLLQRHLIGDEGERLAVLERLALASWEAGQRDRAKAYLQKLLGERADHEGGLALRQRFEDG